MTAHEAYAIAFPKSKNPGQDAARLLSDKNPRKPEILAEIQRIREKVEKMPGSVFLTMQEKRNFLARVVRCHLHTEPVDSDLIQEISRTKRTIGRGDEAEEWDVEKVKLPDKIKAIVTDNDLAADGSAAKAADAIGTTMAEFMARIRSNR